MTKKEKPQAFTMMEAAMESDLPAPARFVYFIIAKRYNEAVGYAFPSLRRLSADTGYSVKTVQRAVDTLVEGGWLTKQSGNREGQANRYVPVIPKGLVTVTKGVGHSDLGVGHSDQGGRSQWPTNGKDNGQHNGQENAKEAAQPPVESQEKGIKTSTSSSDLRNTDHLPLTSKETPALPSGILEGSAVLGEVRERYAVVDGFLTKYALSEEQTATARKFFGKANLRLLDQETVDNWIEMKGWALAGV